jgi:uncharacterized DUF497 family protein
MPWKNIIWAEGENGNIEHIAENGLSIGDVEHVVMHANSQGKSRSSGRPMVFGHTEAGEYICVIYERLDEDTIYPVTAYVLEE